MKLRVVFLLSLTFTFETILFGQSYFFGNPFIKDYSTEDFRGGIQSWQIVQDEREILYVANNFGLLEFDGSTWNIYPVKNGTKIRSVHIGSDKNIYVGSQADFGYFVPDSRGILQYYSIADSLPDKHRNFDEVWRIYEDKGTVYFCTFKDIYYYTPGGSIGVIQPDHPLEFTFQVNNQLYVLQWNAGLSRLDAGTLTVVPGGEFFAARQVASVLPLEKSSLLIFTIRDGAYLYDGFHVSPFSPEQGAALGGMVINQAIMLKDGSFALGTQNNGLIILSREGKPLLHLDRTNGLPDETIHTLYQDVHENLWLGLNNGISMVELSSPFSTINGTMGLAGTGYAALQDGADLYLGTNNGLFYCNVKATEKNFRPVANSSGQVYQLSSIGGKVLMGHHNGPFLIRDKKATLLFPEKGVWEFIPVPSQKDHILVGSYTGLSLMKAATGSFTFIRKFDNFSESSRVLDFDREGTLWMAHGYKGIFRLQFDSAFRKIASTRFYNSRHGFPADHLINMEYIKNQRVFPALFGVFQYDGPSDRFISHPAFTKLFQPSEHIIKMEEDILGNVYFISNFRTGRLVFDKFGNVTMETQLFNKIKDLLNDDLGTIHVLDPRNILFSAKDGFIHYNASKAKNLLPFHTHLTSIINISSEKDSLMLHGRRIDKDSFLELPHRLNSLRFVYSSSFYENPEKTEYQYFLENFDNGWSAWTVKSEKEYTNLPEGDYVFHVRARNIFGTMSEAEAFHFSVHPPFYRSPLAYGLFTLTGILLLGLAFYHKDKKFRREKQRIILDQEKAMIEKDSEIKQIADQSEQEIIRLKNEKLQTEVDHMNRELASSTIHLINKNELLNNVKLGLEDILKSKNGEGHQDEMRKIIRNINHNISSDGDWKQFELHFNNVHGNFTHRLLEKFPRLTPQEIKLCAYLRLNLNTKEIAHLLNISVRGVEISRYRLRKKLNLERNANLTDFMLKF